MRRISGVLLVALFAAACAFGQAIPPINLNAELMQAGEVSLTWEEPPDGLFEDFNDGLAQGFIWEVFSGSMTIDGGYAKIISPSSTDWASGYYEAVSFDDFTAEITYEEVSGTASRGILFRGDGVKDNTYNGYGYWTAGGMFSVWRYNNGNYTNVHSWTSSALINTGAGASNTLKVTGQGSTFTLYINGTQVGSFTDSDFTSGYVGPVSAYGNTVWFDEITCLFGVIPAPDDAPVVHGQQLQGDFDPMGRPLNETAVREQQRMLATAQSGNPSGGDLNEIDEFVEYRIYRDGNYIGSSTTEAYTDNLPQPGEYNYSVTAYYDPEGESSPAGPLLVNWEPVVLTLTGQVTSVPPEGGLIYYDVSVWNTLPQTFNNINWWTTVVFPNGQEFGPLTQMSVNIPGFLNTTVQGLSQNIPNLAPGGDYVFTGHMGNYPNSILQDSFTFDKQGVTADNAQYNLDGWYAQGELDLASDRESAVSLPAEYALSTAYPNPFNPSTSFSVSLPDAAELTVTVYNIAGQRVATLADGMTSAGQHEYTFDASGLASGLYFVQAVVPGQMNEIRKVTLLR
ncbi:T9SS type A sorting domain-containing protein [bacterium]|nr:T9SS type A sorting domain-containing protein [bacterium]